jgi:hypothetical protein
LFSLPAVKEQILESGHHSLRTVLYDLETSPDPIEIGSYVMDMFPENYFHQQQDCEESFQHILDANICIMSWFSFMSRDSLIGEIDNANLKHTGQIKTVKHMYVKDLILPVTLKTRSPCSLEKCLDRHFSPKILTQLNDELFKAGFTHQATEMKIAEFPKVFVLYCKRANYIGHGEDEDSDEEISALTDNFKLFDLESAERGVSKPETTKIVESKQGGGQLARIDQVLEIPVNIDLTNISEVSNNGDYQYRIHGMIVHDGSPSELGHYVAYIREHDSPETNDQVIPAEWIMYNDQHVCRCSELTNDNAWTGNSFPEYIKRGCAMLFYIRKSERSDLFRTDPQSFHARILREALKHLASVKKHLLSTSYADFPLQPSPIDTFTFSKQEVMYRHAIPATQRKFSRLFTGNYFSRTPTLQFKDMAALRQFEKQKEIRERKGNSVWFSFCFRCVYDS